MDPLLLGDVLQASSVAYADDASESESTLEKQLSKSLPPPGWLTFFFMPSLSRHYGLPQPLEFLDVDIANDNRMFLDPYAVRLQKGPSPFARQAKNCMTSFFDEVVDCIVSPGKSRKQSGLELLQHFHEPKETRLGLAKRGFNGHGGADFVGNWIWEALTTEAKALIEVGVLKRVEHLPLFVEGIDKDITSDVTTRIIFEPLARFTKAMVQKYPQFTSGRNKTDFFRRQVWNVAGKEWIEKDLELPVAREKPLLLLPKHWARPQLLMFAGRYYETLVLTHVQEQLGAINPKTGKLEADSKKVLKRKRKFRRGRPTIVRITEEARASEEDLVDRFRVFVEDKYKDLTDDEIKARLRRRRGRKGRS